MTLGGAWLLEDSFIYDGSHEIAFFIQHPFQEKVLAEVMNLQNLKYPYEMIRHWYKWVETKEQNKVNFTWIRESVQPVCNVVRITDNLKNKLNSNEKKTCWKLIKEELNSAISSSRSLRKNKNLSSSDGCKERLKAMDY